MIRFQVKENVNSINGSLSQAFFQGLGWMMSLEFFKDSKEEKKWEVLFTLILDVEFLIKQEATHLFLFVKYNIKLNKRSISVAYLAFYASFCIKLSDSSLSSPIFPFIWIFQKKLKSLATSDLRPSKLQTKNLSSLNPSN